MVTAPCLDLDLLMSRDDPTIRDIQMFEGKGGVRQSAMPVVGQPVFIVAL
jgi:hypothetical protein